MSHIYINPNMHHMSMKTHWSIFIYAWNHMTMTPLDINPLTSSSIHDPSIKLNSWSINHYINILWQDVVPLTSILWHQWKHDPTISPFGIDGNTNIDVNTNNWWQHVDKALLYINRNSITSMWLSLPLWHQWKRVVLSLGLLPLPGCLWYSFE